MGGKIQLSNGKKFKTFLVRPPVFDFFVVRQVRLGGYDHNALDNSL
jgi:hypothetical protein